MASVGDGVKAEQKAYGTVDYGIRRSHLNDSYLLFALSHGLLCYGSISRVFWNRGRARWLPG